LVKRSPEEYRIAGEIIHPRGVFPRREMTVEKVRRAKGIGRWVYCKYCYKSVQPLLGGINQVVCEQCGYGLTPDFFTFTALKRYLAGESYENVVRDDRKSKEAKAWMKKKGLRKS